MAKKDEVVGPPPTGQLASDTVPKPAASVEPTPAAREEQTEPEPDQLNPVLTPPATLKTADASFAHQISVRGKYKVAIRDYRGEALINCAHLDEAGQTVSYDFVDGVAIIPESSIEHFTDEARFIIVGSVI